MSTSGTGAAALGSKLDALASIAQETCPERRRTLLRHATDVFFAPEPVPLAVVELFDTAMEKLAASLEAELRADLARRLSTLSDAPRRLVSRLIGDPDGEVAQPMLEFSRALSEDDLYGVAQRGGQVHLRAVSRRDDLTERVTDRIVDRGDDETLGVLVSNNAAPLSRASSETVVDRAKANPALHAAVVGRENLPVDLLNDMYLVVEQRLREKIMARNAALPPEMLEEALSGSRVRLAAQQGALPPDYTEAVAYIEKLAAAGPIAPQTLVGFLRKGERTRFAAAVAHEAGVDFGVARRTLDRSDGDAMALLCKAAGHSEDLFRDIMLQLRPAAAGIELQQRYAALARETAQRMVRFWKMRQAGAALAA